MHASSSIASVSVPASASASHRLYLRLHRHLRLHHIASHLRLCVCIASHRIASVSQVPDASTAARGVHGGILLAARRAAVQVMACDGM